MPGIDVDRARWRTTLAYQITPTLSAGIEYNPLADDVGLIANWLALPETDDAPALIFGTSSDRIGTPERRAVYGTLSKDLEAWTMLPIAPYLGLAYSGYDEEVNVIGGLVVRWSADWSSTHIWDGHNLHHLLETTIGERHNVGLLVVEQDGAYDVGLTYSISFSMPWEK
ncbi:MAG: hypothetical protein HZA53_15895 [Planctomycetes bacterium]|nr:hypothetical protein [Planctomycetota bacterium]